jgi:6-phosphofructokinase 2
VTRILTLTLNPAIDMFGDADRVVPTHKVRMRNTRYEPGGGGINVARVITALGGEAEALFLSGGDMGDFLGSMLDAEGIPRHAVKTAGQTRIAFMVRDAASGLEYRFLPQGPEVSETDLERLFTETLSRAKDLIVASGSLPPGAPVDTFARLAGLAHSRGLRFVLDTSGAALGAALSGGGIYLVKPSRSELEQVAGTALDDEGLAAAAQRLITGGHAELVAVTLGSAGALLASRDGVERLPALAVEVRSAVGAGDSFLGAMVWALSEGWPRGDAFRLAMAAGAAATMNTGTALCSRSDVMALYEQCKAGKT